MDTTVPFQLHTGIRAPLTEMDWFLEKKWAGNRSLHTMFTSFLIKFAKPSAGSNRETPASSYLPPWWNKLRWRGSSWYFWGQLLSRIPLRNTLFLGSISNKRLPQGSINQGYVFKTLILFTAITLLSFWKDLWASQVQCTVNASPFPFSW